MNEYYDPTGGEAELLAKIGYLQEQLDRGFKKEQELREEIRKELTAEDRIGRHISVEGTDSVLTIGGMMPRCTIRHNGNEFKLEGQGCIVIQSGGYSAQGPIDIKDYGKKIKKKKLSK